MGEPMADGECSTVAAADGKPGLPAVNIINTGDVEAFAEGFARRVRRDAAQQWCRRNLLKYSLREPRLARPVGQDDIDALLANGRKTDLPTWVRDALTAGRRLHWFAPDVETWDSATDFIQAVYGVVEWIEALPEDDRRWR